jgi:hypothetical protein
LDGSFLGLDLPSRKVGAVVGNGQLEIPHAEIESSEMMLHPRLQLMLFYGGRVAPKLLGYTGEFFFTHKNLMTLRPICAQRLIRIRKGKNLEPEANFCRNKQ